MHTAARCREPSASILDAAPTVRCATPQESDRAGDPVARHARGVFRYLRVLGASSSVADDLTQEAFVVAWRRDKQHLPPAALGAFLRRSARNLWLAHTRREQRQAAVEAELADAADRLWETLPGSDADDTFVAAVHRCVAGLAPRARQALQLVYVEEVGRDAVARRLGLLPNGLKMLLQRARQLVIQCARRNR